MQTQNILKATNPGTEHERMSNYSRYEQRCSKPHRSLISKHHVVYLVLTGLALSLAHPSNGQLPDQFFQEEIAQFNLPVGVTFDDRGYTYVWEKGGVVWAINSNDIRLPDPFLDLSEEVAEWRDHGLLGFALDPDFLFNGFVYCMYTVDRHHLFHFNTPQYSVDSTIVNQATIARITRFAADAASGFTKVPYHSRKVLLGKDKFSAIPIPNNLHGIGSLVFGDDGSLLASVGDGGPDFQPQFSSDFHIHQALDEGITTEQEAVGPFRAQLLQCLNGKILRLDPKTGDGLADNPWFENNAPRSARSRVWTLGIRNPYRMKIIPGSGDHNVGQGNPGIIVFGDVGGGRWEEINFIDQPGLNCGWPVYEGNDKTGAWANSFRQNQYAPNPLFGTGDCEKEFFDFQDLLLPKRYDDIYNWKNPCNENTPVSDTIPRFYHHWPLIDFSNLTWNNPPRARTAFFIDASTKMVKELAEADSPVSGPNFGGFSAMAGFWYADGNLPENYNNTFWIADYSGWIKILKLDETYQLLEVDSFANFEHDIVDLEFNPHNQSIYFPDIASGRLYKISYGAVPPPVLVVARDTFWGASPLTVQFDASSSFHPESVPFDFHWDFGDGNTAGIANPEYTFSTNNGEPKSFEVKLELTDSVGNKAEKILLVSINNSPPDAKISSVLNGAVYPVSGPTSLKLEGDVRDIESNDQELEYSWQTFLHHNAHFHPEPIDTHRIAYSLISPLGCNGELYYFRIRLKVSDPQGLSTSDEVTIFPDCDKTGLEFGLEAEGRENTILVFWQMDDISNVKDITVQKVTSKIEEWDIGTVAINGTGAYQFEDFNPLHGFNHYRLRINYNDGTFDYSEFARQIFPPPPFVSIYPNPVNDKIQIQITDINGLTLNWRLLTTDGKFLQSGQFPVPDADFIDEQIDLSAFQNGTYLIEIRVGKKTHTEKIIIMR